MMKRLSHYELKRYNRKLRVEFEGQGPNIFNNSIGDIWPKCDWYTLRLTCQHSELVLSKWIYAAHMNHKKREKIIPVLWAQS